MSSPPSVAPDNPALNTYVRLVIAAGAVAVAAALLLDGSSDLTGESSDLFWLFLVLFTLAEARPMAWLRRDEGGEVTASWTFAFALLLVAPPSGVLLGVACACLLSDALHRKPVVRGLFNAANQSVSLGVGSLILGVTGQRSALFEDDPGFRWFVAFLVTGAAVLVLNSALTSAVLALVQNRPTWPMIREGVRLNLATDAMLLALAPILVVVAQRSLTFVPLLVLTTWAVYRSVQLALSRQHESTHDSLTGLPNRRLFVEQAAAACVAAEERQQPLVVVLIDLDHFKAVNDHLGQHVGDRCLQEVADRLQALKRTPDLLARIGGDDFALLVTGAAAGRSTTTLVSRLREALEEPCIVGGVPVAVTARFGMAVYPEHGGDAETLLRNADHAVFAAKGELSKVATYEASKDERRHNRWDLLGELSGALESGQLTLHYQPKLDVQTGRLVGCEALVRWEHPQLGLIPPVQFMPFAENTELIHPLTEQILRMALTQSACWQRLGLRLDMSVNASTRNLHDLHFPDMVQGLLAETGVAPEALEVEITENTVMSDPVRSTTVLAGLREQRIRIAVDDFGTGYSSLAHLRDLSIDAVKIDRSFITEMASNGRDGAIVQAIIDLARRLGVETVAEGIETVGAWEALQRLGCDHGQGYLIARPLPAPAMTAWVQELPCGVWHPGA